MLSHRTAGGTQGSGASPDYTSQEDFARDLEEIQRRSYERQKAIEKGLGFGSEDAEEAAQKQRADSIAKIRQAKRERNRPNLVIKSADTNADKFNTVTASEDAVEAKLIRAMIDQTTKAKEGTRLRFKLLDDVTVSGTKLRKGTYLYGTVSGFGQQRVRATITSILAGDKFIKVKLSVFDNDGMEGFYVPESAFRDFVKDAGSSTVQQNISFESENGYGSGISERSHCPAGLAEHVQFGNLCHFIEYPQKQGENQVQYDCLSDQFGGCPVKNKDENR